MARDDTVLPALPFVSMTNNRSFYNLKEAEIEGMITNTGYRSETNIIEEATASISNSPHMSPSGSMHATSPMLVT